MSKTYSEAYALGQKDGEQGENKMAWRSFTRTLTNVGSYLPGAENRDDEWLKGYRQGFEDQVRLVNVNIKQEGGGAMGLNSFSGVGSDGYSATSGGQNSFAHRIAVAENLYQQVLTTERVLYQTEQDFGQLFVRHELLASEFFNDLLTYHIRPRIAQIQAITETVSQIDRPVIQSFILKYQQAIRGKEQGLTAANQYFAAINLAAVQPLSGLSVAVSQGDPRDYHTQLAVAHSIKQVFETLMSQVDAISREYHHCIQDHDQLMKQDFDGFIRNNVEPRLQDLSDLWRAIHDKDIAGIDDVISRLNTVSSI